MRAHTRSVPIDSAALGSYPYDATATRSEPLLAPTSTRSGAMETAAPVARRSTVEADLLGWRCRSALLVGELGQHRLPAASRHRAALPLECAEQLVALGRLEAGWQQ